MNHPQTKLGQVRFSPLDAIRPSPENDRLYRPIDPNDPDIQALAQSIRERGVKEPLVITEDNWILSGHRRHVAAGLAGLSEVPVRTEPIRRDEDPDEFLRLLREFNRQREKSFDEKLREEIVSSNPHEAHWSLTQHRRQSAMIDVPELQLRGRKTRSRISNAKMPFLEAIERILDAQKNFWPLSIRRIHYALLNDPPLRHASKPGSRYRNDLKSYKSLDELAT